MPTVPKPVYNELYDTNVTAWMLQTQEKIIEGKRQEHVIIKSIDISSAVLIVVSLQKEATH